jgi:hypothetical protein
LVSKERRRRVTDGTMAMRLAGYYLVAHANGALSRQSVNDR